MKTRLIGLAVGFVLGLAFSLLNHYGVQAHAADALPSETYYTGRTLSTWSRSNAQTIALTVRSEPYDTLGGWWLDNDYEDPWDATKGNEGADCSGLLFKSWMLVHQQGITGYSRWYTSDDTHGPYKATHFFNNYAGCPTVCRKLCGGPGTSCGTQGAYLYVMDAYTGQEGEDFHVATYHGLDVYGVDRILESYLSGWELISTDYYRYATNYIAIERYSW